MSEDHVVSFSLEVNVEEALTNIRRAQTLIYRTLGLMRRLGMPEDLNAAMITMQKLITVMNQLRLAAIALQAASGPIGWALAAVSIGTTAVTMMDFGNSVYDQTRGA